MTFTARYAGVCSACGEPFPAGTALQRGHVTGLYSHEVCDDDQPDRPAGEICGTCWLEKSSTGACGCDA